MWVQQEKWKEVGKEGDGSEEGAMEKAVFTCGKRQGGGRERERKVEEGGGKSGKEQGGSGHSQWQAVVGEEKRRHRRVRRRSEGVGSMRVGSGAGRIEL